MRCEGYPIWFSCCCCWWCCCCDGWCPYDPPAEYCAGEVAGAWCCCCGDVGDPMAIWDGGPECECCGAGPPDGMESGGGGAELLVWGEVAPRVFDAGAEPPPDEVLVAEERRRRLSPVDARPPCEDSSSSFGSSSSLEDELAGPPLIERPPGMLLETGGPPGPPMGPDERPRGAPTGIDDGREPWGALRHA